MDIGTPENPTNVHKISRDPDINIPGNGKFQNPKFPKIFSVPTSREETLVLKKETEVGRKKRKRPPKFLGVLLEVELTNSQLYLAQISFLCRD